MQTPEQVAWEALGSEDFVLVPHEVLTDLIRARDAEVRADERAKVLAGFVEEHKDRRSCGCGTRVGWIGPCCLERGDAVRIERRLVGPWEPTP